MFYKWFFSFIKHRSPRPFPFPPLSPPFLSPFFFLLLFLFSLAVAAAPPPFGWLWLAALPPSSPAAAPPSLGGFGWRLRRQAFTLYRCQSALIGSRCCFHCTCPPFAAFQEVPILVELGPVSHKAWVMIFRSGGSKYNAPILNTTLQCVSKSLLELRWTDTYIYIYINMGRQMYSKPYENQHGATTNRSGVF